MTSTRILMAIWFGALLALGYVFFSPPGGGDVALPGHRAVSVTAAPRQVGADGGRWYDYEPATFVQDVGSGRTVLVAVHADWCGDCAVQGPIITRLIKEPGFETAVGYVIDFDSERRFLLDHKVRTQSTLLVFRGGAEVGRAVGNTSEKDIRALFQLGL
ncbi:MAG: thioredoxin family protein [Alphaproteobacteria bacterium]|nr:thioredoxin family protein [Alphaproteobacteria bacterium]